ncbi:MAG TPA: YSC84-related protein [Nitrospiraceae bacterium]|nr:YSC84-related protein [Nitrospiraceae bacterium]
MQDIRNSYSGGRTAGIVGLLTIFLVLLAAVPSDAIINQEAAEIDAKTEEALKAFEAKVPQAKDLLKGAKGYLVMPALYKAGFIGAAQYGEGALRVNGKTVDYYNFAALSFGAQAGAEKTSLLLLFNSDDALTNFRKAPGFEVGVDANVTLITIGETGSFDSTKAGQPILAFVFGQRGLMAGVTLKGAKFTKLDRD